jgi:hypothetical protein
MPPPWPSGAARANAEPKTKAPLILTIVSKLLLAFIVAPFPYSFWEKPGGPSLISLLSLFFYMFRRPEARTIHGNCRSARGRRRPEGLPIGALPLWRPLRGLSPRRRGGASPPHPLGHQGCPPALTACPDPAGLPMGDGCPRPQDGCPAGAVREADEDARQNRGKCTAYGDGSAGFRTERRASQEKDPERGAVPS